MILPLPRLERLGQVELVEQHVAELLGRVDVELDAALLPDFARLLAGLALQALRHFGEHFGVDLDAGGFHARQHGRHGEIDVVVNLAQSGGGDFFAEFVREAQREVGGFAEAVAHLEVEGAEGDVGQAVFRVGRVEQVGVEQGIVLHARQRDAALD